MKFEWDEEKNIINKKNTIFLLKLRHMFLTILSALKCTILSIVQMKIVILHWE